MTRVKVGIVGATGYTGCELCRLLAQHPHAEVTHLYSNSYAGQKISQIYPHLSFRYQNVLETFQAESVAKDIDVLFLALPHGEAHKFMPTLLKQHVRIIDLSADFRLSDPKLFEKYYKVTHASPEILRDAALGFPELHREAIQSCRCCANPGCYSTAVILGLYPLAQAGLLDSGVIVDAKSGVTGAGRSLKQGSLYCEVNEGMVQYNTFAHRHMAEMESELKARVHFSPHLIPMDRGILASMYVSYPEKLSETAIIELYHKFYQKSPFVVINQEISSLSTKYVVGTNYCMIHIKCFQDRKQLVVFSAIDNLIKGASGQAVQNMNLMFNFDETEGLRALSYYI